MIQEKDLSNIEYFHAESSLYQGQTFNLVARYKGHKFFVRENIKMNQLARMDINTIENILRPQLMEKLLSMLTKEFPNG